MRDQALARELAERGVFFPGNAILAEDEDRLNMWRRDWMAAANDNPGLVTTELRIAMDAQPGLVTTPNAGIPLLFTSIVDPEIVRVIFQPLNATQVYGGEVQKGSWITDVDYFPLVEPTGQVAAYGDFSNNGEVDVNVQWTPRQPYGYQTFKRYGEKQIARWGAAGINYSAELDMARMLKFQQFQNGTYFNGVAGLINYGALNDPSLIAAIAPFTKGVGGTSWATVGVTADEIYNDIALKLYVQLVTQMGGNIKSDAQMVLALSNFREPFLARKTTYGLTVRQYLMQTFPNLTIVTAPQFSTGSGELVQLFLPRYDGIQTVVPAYTEKLRTHALVTEPSAWKQKLSAGTWGSIIRRPIAIAQMIGI
jgi:hypothetical protein